MQLRLNFFRYPMNFKNLLGLGALLILFSACGTSYYYAEFIQPSGTYIPSKVRHVGVVNLSSTPALTATVRTNGSAEQVTRITDMLANRTVNALKLRLVDIGRYVPMLMTQPGYALKGDGFKAPFLSPHIVDSLCRAYGLEGIIALEGVQVTVDTRGEVGVTSVSDPSGTPVQMPEFSSESQVTYTVMWRFYDNVRSIVADTHQDTHQMTFTKVAYSEQALQEARRDESILSDVALFAAETYFERISPHWKQDYRTYYQSGSDEFYNIAMQLDMDGDWESAAAKWMNFIDHPEKKLAYRSNFNMAVASEMLGNPREAREWLEKAIAIKDTQEAFKYMRQIEKQILILDVVHVQLGLPPVE